MNEVINDHAEQQETSQDASGFASLTELPAFNLKKAQENVDQAKASLGLSGETTNTGKEQRDPETILAELESFLDHARIANTEEFFESGTLSPGDSEEDAEKMYSLLDDLALSAKTRLESGTPITQIKDMMANPNGRYDNMSIGEITYSDIEKFDDFLHRTALEGISSWDPSRPGVDDTLTSNEYFNAPGLRDLPFCLEDIEKYSKETKANPDLEYDPVAKRKLVADLTFGCAERAIKTQDISDVRFGVMRLWTEYIPESQLTGSLPVSTIVAQKFSDYVTECYDGQRNYGSVDTFTSPVFRKMVDTANDSHTYERPSSDAIQHFGDLLASNCRYSLEAEKSADKVEWLVSTQGYKPMETAIKPYDNNGLQQELVKRGILSEDDLHHLWQYRFNSLEKTGQGHYFSNVDLLPVEDQRAAGIFNEHYQYFYDKAQENLEKPESERTKIFDENGMPSYDIIEQVIIDATEDLWYSSNTQVGDLLLNNTDLLRGHERTMWESSIGALPGEMTEHQEIMARVYCPLYIDYNTRETAIEMKKFLLNRKPGEQEPRYEAYSEDDIKTACETFDIMNIHGGGYTTVREEIAKQILDEGLQDADKKAERFMELDMGGKFAEMWKEYPAAYNIYHDAVLGNTSRDSAAEDSEQNKIVDTEIISLRTLGYRDPTADSTKINKKTEQLRKLMYRTERTSGGEMAYYFDTLSPDEVRKEIEVLNTVIDDPDVHDEFAIPFVKYISRNQISDPTDKLKKFKEYITGKTDGTLSETLPGLNEEIFREMLYPETVEFTSNALVMTDEYTRMKISPIGSDLRRDSKSLELKKFLLQAETAEDGTRTYRYETMSPEAIHQSGDVLTRLYDNNSTQLSNLAPEIATQLLAEPETALEKVSRLEHIFLRKNIPDFAKLYCCANVLFEKNIDNEKDISPVLKESEDTRSVLMTDLLKNAIRSNNRSLRSYLEGVQNAESIDSDEDLNASESTILDDFENGKKFRTRFFGFARNLNFENATQILAEMDHYRSERDAAHRASVIQDENGAYRLRHGISEGDFIKGINSQYIHTMMRDGFNCPEMVGSGASQDVTHWDTDCGSAAGLDSDPTLNGAITRSIASSYGDGLHVVIHNDERFSHTLPGDSSGYVAGTYEAYHGTANGENFRGIRTGFGSEDVDFFVARDKNAKNVWMLKQEIVKTGCYVPIVDRSTEEVIFTPDEFNELRTMMSGTEHYGSELKEFKFADSLELPDSLRGDLHFSELVADYDKKESETRAIQTMLTARLLVAIEQSNLPIEVKEAFRHYNQHVSEDAMPGTVDAISTGSTGRFTNKPHDADFDFIWRIDNSMLQEHGNKITQALTDGTINGAPVIDGYGEGGGNIGRSIRKGLVNIDLLGNPVQVEVDITPVIKTDKLDFSSEQALAERLTQLRAQDEEKYKQVIANIVIAKQVLKQNGVYKKTDENGIGGIGVENWVLQHGGSLMSAAKSFLGHAKNKDGSYKKMADLRSSYAIFDLGENHMSKGYPYDNFLDNLTDGDSGSYHKMIGACEEIVASQQ